MSVVDDLRSVLADRPEIALAVVFGSVARGAAGPRSDLDLGVVLEPPSDDAVARLAIDVSRATGLVVDLIDLRTAPPLLRFEIARDGEVLLDRVPGGWSEFRAHAMIDWWDWAPTARLIHQAAVARLRQKVDRGPA